MALAAINTARATVRARAWALAGAAAPDHQATVKAPLIVDLDATLITAHSEKQLAAATFKRGFGHHPIGAWVDHGDGGTGEPRRDDPAERERRLKPRGRSHRGHQGRVDATTGHHPRVGGQGGRC